MNYRSAIMGLVCLAGAAAAYAQIGGGGGDATKNYVDAQIATVMAAMPKPMATVPPQPSGAGTVGSSNSFFPADGAQRQTVQRTTVTTDAQGNWTVTFNPGFTSSTPTVNPIPINSTAAQPIICNVKTRSPTTETGYCWQASTITITLAALPLVGNIFSTGAPATPVMIIGAEPTQ